VVNQWGRDSNLSASGSRSSGGAGIVIAAIVALLLGAGGGYTGARLLGGASAGDITTRDQKIAELEKQVSDLKFTTSGNANQENVLRERVQELTKANETLKALVDENDNQGSADAQAEIAALKKTIEEAGAVRAELNRARRSQQVSELQIIELEGEIKTQRTEMEKLRKSLTDAATQGDAGNRALSDQIKALEAALAESRKQATAAADLRKQVASLEDDITQKTAELSTARDAAASLKKDVDKAKSELTKVKKGLAAAQAVASDGTAALDAARRDLAAANELLDVRNRGIRALEKQLATAVKELNDAKERASGPNAENILLSQNLASMRADKEKLESEVAVLKQTIENLKGAQDEVKPQPDVTESGDDTPAARRDADDVRDALEDMPGFGRLTPEKQIELARRLEEGECAADALKSTLGRVPAIALRNLIRDLGSKC
jgi:chromosome segregation ATPase